MKPTPLTKNPFLKLTIMVVIVCAAAAAIALWWTQSGESGNRFIKAGPFEIAVAIEPDPPRVGDNRLRIEVRNAESEPVTAAEVRAVAQMPATDTMDAMHAPAEIRESAPGVYTGKLDLSMRGEWPLAVDVATDEEHHVDLVFDMATGEEGLQLATATPEGDIAYHTCSMHPSVKSAAPGTCPICGMDLVPVTREEVESGSVMLDAARRQTIGVTTDEAFVDELVVPVRLVGRVTYDEARRHDINLRFDGWIGELHADFEGKPVKKGDKLFSVYSPELLSLQEEYLQTLKHGRQPTLVAAAENRLRLFGLTAAQIDWLGQQDKVRDYLPIFAPADGVVIEKRIVAGSAFKTGETLLRLADLSKVWIEAQAYEQDIPLLETGQPAEVRIPNLPKQNFTAELMQIDPFLQANTRTARVRLVRNNEDGALKPGMFADVRVKVSLGEKLLVREEAVLVSGDTRVVFVDQGEGRLKPKTIQTGYSNGHCIEVVEGLEAGDKVVTSGNFLIAAESKLKAGIDQW